MCRQVLIRAIVNLVNLWILYSHSAGIISLKIFISPKFAKIKGDP